MPPPTSSFGIWMVSGGWSMSWASQLENSPPPPHVWLRDAHHIPPGPNVSNGYKIWDVLCSRKPPLEFNTSPLKKKDAWKILFVQDVCLLFLQVLTFRKLLLLHLWGVTMVGRTIHHLKGILIDESNAKKNLEWIGSTCISTFFLFATYTCRVYMYIYIYANINKDTHVKIAQPYT